MMKKGKFYRNRRRTWNRVFVNGVWRRVDNYAYMPKLVKPRTLKRNALDKFYNSFISYLRSDGIPKLGLLYITKRNRGFKGLCTTTRSKVIERMKKDGYLYSRHENVHTSRGMVTMYNLNVNKINEVKELEGC